MRYETTIQDARSNWPVEAAIAGKAVAMMVWSTTARNIGSMIEGKTVRNAGYLATGPAGFWRWSGPFDKIWSCSCSGRKTYQCAIRTGKLALARMWRVAPPKIIWRSLLCV